MELFSRVKLNIGGTIFETTKSTLVKYNGFFKTMLETGNPVKPDDSGCIFLDRDPTHFRLILNFMRDGRVELPESTQAIREIGNEADFYMLDGLKELCQSRLNSGTELRILDDNTNMLQLTVNPVKPIMIVFFHQFPQGEITYPDGLEMSSFLAKYQDRFDIFFKQSSEGWNWSLYKPGFTFHSNSYTPWEFPGDVDQTVEAFFAGVRPEKEKPIN